MIPQPEVALAHPEVVLSWTYHPEAAGAMAQAGQTEILGHMDSAALWVLLLTDHPMHETWVLRGTTLDIARSTRAEVISP